MDGKIKEIPIPLGTKHIFSLSLEYSQECVPDAKLTHEIDAFKRCISPFLRIFNGC